MSAIESVGSFIMPPLTGALDGLWDVILDLADNLPPMSWELVGGQMVMAHGLAAGRTPTRASPGLRRRMWRRAARRTQPTQWLVERARPSWPYRLGRGLWQSVVVTNGE